MQVFVQGRRGLVVGTGFAVKPAKSSLRADRALEAKDMENRREFLTRALYVAPAILTVAVRPSFAAGSYGSSGGGSEKPKPEPKAAYRIGGEAPWWAFWHWFD